MPMHHNPGPATLPELTEMMKFLEDGAALLRALRDNVPVDQEMVERSREMVRAIRDGLERGGGVLDAVKDLRDELVARLYAADRTLKIDELAQDAGFSGGYVSRVSAAHGAERRTHRARGSTPANSC